MIPGFDAGVRGLEVGDIQTVRIEPDEAYGGKVIQQTLPTNIIQDIL